MTDRNSTRPTPGLQASKKSYAAEFAEQIIAQLKEGAAPWQKPWRAGEIRRPFNAATQTNYKGANVLRLVMAGYQDPR